MTDQFTRHNAIMLLVDHQAGIMESTVRFPALDEVKRNVRVLAEAAKLFELPVIITSAAEQYQGPVIDELQQALPKAHEQRIERRGEVNALDDERVVAALKAAGRKNVITAGIGTDVCGIHSALGLKRSGYNVQFVADCAGTSSEYTNDIALHRLEQEGVALATTAQITSELLGDFSTPEGGQLVQILLGRFEKS